MAQKTTVSITYDNLLALISAVEDIVEKRALDANVTMYNTCSCSSKLNLKWTENKDSSGFTIEYLASTDKFKYRIVPYVRKRSLSYTSALLYINDNAVSIYNSVDLAKEAAE